MIVSQLHEIASIDHEITELHNRLAELYSYREEICLEEKTVSRAEARSTMSLGTFDDEIDLEGINLTLTD